MGSYDSYERERVITHQTSPFPMSRRPTRPHSTSRVVDRVVVDRRRSTSTATTAMDAMSSDERGRARSGRRERDRGGRNSGQSRRGHHHRRRARSTSRPRALKIVVRGLPSTLTRESFASTLAADGFEPTETFEWMDYVAGRRRRGGGGGGGGATTTTTTTTSLSRFYAVVRDPKTIQRLIDAYHGTRFRVRARDADGNATEEEAAETTTASVERAPSAWTPETYAATFGGVETVDNAGTIEDDESYRSFVDALEREREDGGRRATTTAAAPRSESTTTRKSTALLEYIWRKRAQEQRATTTKATGGGGKKKSSSNGTKKSAKSTKRDDASTAKKDGVAADDAPKRRQKSKPKSKKKSTTTNATASSTPPTTTTVLKRPPLIPTPRA